MSYLEPRHPIKVVVSRTGLTAHVLRVWERRYGAIKPARTDSNRRLYSDADIDRLRLLHRATAEGHAIGQIATMPEETLKELIATEAYLPNVDGEENARSTARSTPGQQSPERFLESCKAAARSFDTIGLEAALVEARLMLSLPALLEEVVTPLLIWVGDTWRDGTGRIAHEHLTSATTRRFLNELRPLGARVDSNAPAIVVATPPGQLHEAGAMMVAIVAASEGWRDVYLGPNIPMEEIANAVRQTGARAVALSMVYPSDDTGLIREFDQLYRYLPERTAVLTGGAGSKAYRAMLEERGARWLPNLHTLRLTLEELRKHDDVRVLDPM